MSKIALVTGSSSGIGEAVCRRLCEAEYRVYGLSRRGTAPEGCVPIKADVSDENSVRAAVDSVIQAEGRIDLLINNAGFGIAGPVEYTPGEEAARLMNVNFMGQFYTAKAVLPHMRRQNEGRIVFISSVAAPIAIPYQSFYSASKSAVSSLALALRNEVKNTGIKVTVFLPGDVRTGFTDARSVNDYQAKDYANCQASIQSMEKDERNGMTPEYVAERIFRAATVPNPAPQYIGGFKYKLFALLFRLLPSRLSYWIVGKMY